MSFARICRIKGENLLKLTDDWKLEISILQITTLTFCQTSGKEYFVEMFCCYDFDISASAAVARLHNLTRGSSSL